MAHNALEMFLATQKNDFKIFIQNPNNKLNYKEAEEALERHHTRLIKLAAILHSASSPTHTSPRIITPKRRSRAIENPDISDPTMSSPQKLNNRERSSKQATSIPERRSLLISETTLIINNASSPTQSQDRSRNSMPPTARNSASQALPQTPPSNERRPSSKRRIPSDPLAPITHPASSPAKKPLLQTTSKAWGSELTKSPTYKYKGPTIQQNSSPPSRLPWDGNIITTSDQLWHRGQQSRMRNQEDLWDKMERDKAKEKLKTQK